MARAGAQLRPADCGAHCGGVARRLAGHQHALNGARRVALIRQTPGRLSSPVLKNAISVRKRSPEYSNSKRAQENGADEREHREHGKHVEL
jgi:hypothetical protein